MSIENALAALQAAVEANTAAVLKAGGTVADKPAADKPAAAAKAPAKAAKSEPKVDRSTMNAALSEVKEKKGLEIAKGLIAKPGGAAKMADIADDKIQAVYDACKKVMEAEESEEETEGM